MEFTHKEWVVRKKREADAYALTRPSYHFPLKWKREFLPKEIEAMKNQFGQFDADRSGAIDADELLGILNSLGEDVGREQVEALIREVDHNNSRELEFDEFVELMHNLRHSRSRSGAAAALQAAQYGVRIAAELRALQGRRALPGVVAKETKAPETDNAHASGAPPARARGAGRTYGDGGAGPGDDDDAPAGARLLLEGLVVRNGRASSGGVINASGGAVWASGSLVLRRCAFEHCSLGGDGGAAPPTTRPSSSTRCWCRRGGRAQAGAARGAENKKGKGV